MFATPHAVARDDWRALQPSAEWLMPVAVCYLRGVAGFLPARYCAIEYPLVDRRSLFLEAGRAARQLSPLTRESRA